MPTISLTPDEEVPAGISLLTLTRGDTGGTPAGVTLPAAFTAVGDAWQYEFDAPAAGLHYDYTFRITWTDGTISDGAGDFNDSAAETYGTDDDIDQAFGTRNVTSWSDLNGNGDAGEISTRKAWARAQAKLLIHEALAADDLTVPATADTFTFHSSLASIEATLAGVLLYQSRGINDAQAANGADGAMQVHYDRAMARLAKLVGDHLALDGDDSTAPAGTFQFVTINRGTACAGDEFASN